MSITTSPNRHRAVAALNSLLTQVSAVTLKDIAVGKPLASSEPPGREIDILAQVEVFGRTHALACQISSGSDLQGVGVVLEGLRQDIASLPGKPTPVLILPVLSPEVQALCDANKTAFLDLRGNGRLAIDEVFISTRSLPRRSLHRSVSASALSLPRPLPAAAEHAGESIMRRFPPIPAASPQRLSSASRPGRAR